MKTSNSILTKMVCKARWHAPKAMIFVLIAGVLIALETTSQVPVQITISCDKPTQRADGTLLLDNEITGYNFALNGKDIGTRAGSPCGFVYYIPAGQCVHVGDTFSGQVVDSLGQKSSWVTSRPMPREICGPTPPPPPKPAAPSAPSNMRLSAPK